MAEKMDQAIIKQTQEKLGKYVTQPELTEKVLQSPTFQFVHDIVAQISKQYGTFGDLFSKDELKSGNIKDKDKKIAFLQKLIKYLSTELSTELKAQPAKIVADSEPEKTNEMLQAMASLLEKKQATKTDSNSTSDKINGNGIKASAKPVVNSAVKPTDMKKTSENSTLGAVPSKTEDKTMADKNNETSTKNSLNPSTKPVTNNPVKSVPPTKLGESKAETDVKTSIGGTTEKKTDKETLIDRKTTAKKSDREVPPKEGAKTDPIDDSKKKGDKGQLQGSSGIGNGAASALPNSEDTSGVKKQLKPEKDENPKERSANKPTPLNGRRD